MADPEIVTLEVVDRLGDDLFVHQQFHDLRSLGGVQPVLPFALVRGVDERVGRDRDRVAARLEEFLLLLGSGFAVLRGGT